MIWEVRAVAVARFCCRAAGLDSTVAVVAADVVAIVADVAADFFDSTAADKI